MITPLRIARTPFARRQASTVQKATKTAETVQAKTSDALGSAQATAGKAFEQVKGLGEKAGSVVGNLLGCTLFPFFALCRLALC